MTFAQTAKALGYAGLIPFIVLSTGTWIELPGVADAHFILTTYAAVILSFMGAIHWGIAMTRQDDGASRRLSLSVVPALLAWVALLIPVIPAYSVLIIGFVALCGEDIKAARHGHVPRWYIPMRITLTTIVIVSLIGAALARVVSN